MTIVDAGAPHAPATLVPAARVTSTRQFDSLTAALHAPRGGDAAEDTAPIPESVQDALAALALGDVHRATSLLAARPLSLPPPSPFDYGLDTTHLVLPPPRQARESAPEIALGDAAARLWRAASRFALPYIVVRHFPVSSELKGNQDSTSDPFAEDGDLKGTQVDESSPIDRLRDAARLVGDAHVLLRTAPRGDGTLRPRRIGVRGDAPPIVVAETPQVLDDAVMRAAAEDLGGQWDRYTAAMRAAGTENGAADGIDAPPWAQLLLGPDRLALLVHHVVADAQGATLLLAHVARVLGGLDDGSTYHLPPCLPRPCDTEAAWSVLDGTRPLTILSGGIVPPPADIVPCGAVTDAFPLAPLLAVAERTGSSLFEAALAAFVMLIHASKDNIAPAAYSVAVPVNGRSSLEATYAAGSFVRTTLARIDADTQQTSPFDAILEAIKAGREQRETLSLDDFGDNERLAEHLHTMFSLEWTPPSPAPPLGVGTEDELLALDGIAAKFPLYVRVDVPVNGGAGFAHVVAEFQLGMYGEEHATTLLQQYCAAMRDLAMLRKAPGDAWARSSILRPPLSVSKVIGNGDVVEQLREIWDELLPVSTTGHSFFERGADSLLVPRLRRLVRDRLSMDLSSRDVYSSTDVVDMASRLRPLASPSPSLPLRDAVPSAAQSRLLLLEQTTPGTYLITLDLFGDAQTDLNRLVWSLRKTVETFPALHTVFPSPLTSKSLLPVHGGWTSPAPAVDGDLSASTVVTLADGRSVSLVDVEWRSSAAVLPPPPLDLVQGPLVRLSLWPVDSSGSWAGLLVLPHVAVDGQALPQLLATWNNVYVASDTTCIALAPRPLERVPTLDVAGIATPSTSSTTGSSRSRKRWA